MNLTRILYCFQRAAGLKVNFEKSGLLGIGTSQVPIEVMAMILGCKAIKLPTTFLGIPVGVNMRSVKHWKFLIDRFKKKMNKWKLKTLSIGGRYTINQNILGEYGNLSVFFV